MGVVVVVVVAEGVVVAEVVAVVAVVAVAVAAAVAAEARVAAVLAATGAGPRCSRRCCAWDACVPREC